LSSSRSGHFRRPARSIRSQRRILAGARVSNLQPHNRRFLRLQETSMRASPPSRLDVEAATTVAGGQMMTEARAAKTANAQNLLLISDEDALEIGYEIGQTLRDNGETKSKETRHSHKWSRDHQASPRLVF